MPAESPRVVGLHLLREHEQPIDEDADPLNVLARREITLGINLQGLVIPDAERVRIAFTLDIDIVDPKS